MSVFSPIEEALNELRQGHMVIVVDDERREQEGDLIIAADKITPDAINFIAQHARGLICLTITEEIRQRLELPFMPERNKLPNQAAFTVSIEAAEGVATGVSTADRACTIKAAVNPKSKPHDISMPGHIFPLCARAGGVFERQGHTEASIDLARLAGFQPAAVICEIMNEDGTMARLPELEKFAEKFKLKIISIQDLIEYRMIHENQVTEVASTVLPMAVSKNFTIKVFQDKQTKLEHVAIIHEPLQTEKPVLVRLHSECLTGDIFRSLRCDCGDQLQDALKKIAAEGGVLLYMRQEGRGIGLTNKIKAYELQSQGLDTVEANEKLGFLADHRNYGLSAQILHHLGIKQIRLLTNNPKKIHELEQFGVTITERVPLEVIPQKENINYLRAKRDKLGHWLDSLD